MTDKATALTDILRANKLKATCIDYSDTSNAEHYDIALEPGGKVNDVKRYLSEICLALKTACSSLSVITEQGCLRLEIAKSKRPTIDLFSYGASVSPVPGELNCLIGQTLRSEPLWLDLAEAPHVLVAGTTGSGKSTVMHSIIANLLNKEIDLRLIDPKGIEFGAYSGAVRTNISFDYRASVAVLRSLHDEMNARYDRMRNGDYDFPYTVLMVDEFADLISQDANRLFYSLLRSLAQKSRAAKIHIVLSTQRPSVDIIDGSIKANFPVRIACKTASMTDSRVILDQPGAEKLIGRGDAILKSMLGTTRFQATYTTAEVVMAYHQPAACELLVPGSETDHSAPQTVASAD